LSNSNNFNCDNSGNKFNQKPKESCGWGSTDNGTSAQAQVGSTTDCNNNAASGW